MKPMSNKGTPITCPCCKHEFLINIGQLMGAKTSPKKAESSKLNGRLGGRPMKSQPVRLRPWHPTHPKHAEWLARQG